MNLLNNKTAVIFIVLIGVVLYGATLKGSIGNFSIHNEYTNLVSAGQAFESSHERSPFAMLLAMREENTVELKKELADFSSPDVAYINNKLYSFFPPGIPLLILPLYEIGSQYNFGVVLSYATIPIISIGCLILLYFIARRIFNLPIWASLLTPLVFGFSTTSWSYAITIYQHLPITFCLLLAFYAAWKFKETKTKSSWLWAIISGASYGVAVFIDYPAALLILPAVFYLLGNSLIKSEDDKSYKFSFRYSVILGLIAIGLFATGHMYYNMKTFGSPIQFHNPAPRYTPETFSKLLESQADNQTTAPTQAISVFNEERIINGVYVLLVAPDKGMFYYSIILLIALFGIAAAHRIAKIETIILLSFAFINFFMYASFADPWGGWAFGPRYLIPAMAVLSIFIGTFVGTNTKLWKKLIVLVGIIISSAVALLGAITSNLAPPKVEAIPLGIPYGIARNLDFLNQNISSSFIYNTYFSNGFSLSVYYLFIYAFLLIVFILVLFVLSREGDKDV